jgi:hypothetical protein
MVRIKRTCSEEVKITKKLDNKLSDLESGHCIKNDGNLNEFISRFEEFVQLKWKRLNNGAEDTRESFECFEFKGEPGIKVDIDENTPLGYFRLFLTNKIIDKIVMETNTFAKQTISMNNNSSGNLGSWEPLCVDELWTFIGIMILQGIVIKPEERMYWSTNNLLKTPGDGL